MARWSVTGFGGLVLGATLAIGSGETMPGNSVGERWSDAFRSKSWVTAYPWHTRPEREPARVDLIVVKIGDTERVVYRGQAEDLGFGMPVVSPDGTHVAFLKQQRIPGRVPRHEGVDDHFTERIYAVTPQGSEAKPVVELTPRGRFAIKGTQTGTPAAWSHDNKKLVFVDKLHGKSNLLLQDLTSGDVVELRSDLRPSSPRKVRTWAFTSQAWAPDNRRLVYVDEQGHAVILDTVTRAREDLGPGTHPTWSPDGRFIALQQYEPSEPKTDSLGDYLPVSWRDYVLVSPEHPYPRSRLLLNPTRGFFWHTRYFGEALWSPDSRFLLVLLLRGETGEWHVLDRISGEIEKLPFRFRGESVGGRP